MIQKTKRFYKHNLNFYIGKLGSIDLKFYLRSGISIGYYAEGTLFLRVDLLFFFLEFSISPV